MEVAKKARTVAGRIFATFLATGLGVVAAGSIAGVELWQSFMMAGIGGVATVVEALSRAYLKDGKLSMEEIDEIFAQADAKLDRE